MRLIHFICNITQAETNAEGYSTVYGVYIPEEKVALCRESGEVCDQERYSYRNDPKMLSELETFLASKQQPNPEKLGPSPFATIIHRRYSIKNVMAVEEKDEASVRQLIADSKAYAELEIKVSKGISLLLDKGEPK